MKAYLRGRKQEKKCFKIFSKDSHKDMQINVPATRRVVMYFRTKKTPIFDLYSCPKVDKHKCNNGISVNQKNICHLELHNSPTIYNFSQKSL